MRAVAFAASLVLLSGLAAGCKGDREKCMQATQRYAELVYWEKANEEIAKLPTLEERDRERKRRIVAFNREIDEQLDFRVQQCIAANADGQADCIIAAKTRADAMKCADIAKDE